MVADPRCRRTIGAEQPLALAVEAEAVARPQEAVQKLFVVVVVIEAEQLAGVAAAVVVEIALHFQAAEQFLAAAVALELARPAHKVMMACRLVVVVPGMTS